MPGAGMYRSGKCRRHETSVVKYDGNGDKHKQSFVVEVK